MAQRKDILIPTLSAILLLLSGCNTLLSLNKGEAENGVSESQLSGQEAEPAGSNQTAAEIPNDELIENHESAAPSEITGEIEETARKPEDLWEKVRAGYRLQPRDNDQINKNLKWFAKHDEYLERIQKRATPYLHFITKEIEKRDMPMELALLPIVESAYNPFAYSPGRAAGIWQFIPSTGKAYGLDQNWWYDGRRDIVAATGAALDYLSYLSKRFNGDWELALAAYNAGGGTVQRAIRKNTKKGLATDYWSLDLPRETERYVPKLLAIAKLIANPSEYGITLTPIPDIPYFDSVDIESQLDLALAAEMADITIDELYRLNPGFNRWASPPAGPHRLNLPEEKVDGFTDKLAELDPMKRLRWKRYKIRSGDNLGAIAEKHGTTVTLLKQTNKLKGHSIRAGKHLLIPISSEQPSHYRYSAEQRQAKTQGRKRKGKKVVYEVQQGDSFWSIALKHRVNHKQLASWNGLSPKDTLRPGQKLTLWIKKGENKVSQTPALPNTSPLASASISKVHYKVRKGDSLARIARRFNISVSDLDKWNGIQGRYLQPGQRLKLYVDITAQAL